MSTLLFANNAATTIAAGINAAAVSVTLAPGTGALFPNPGAGEYFIATFVDNATGLVNEIVKVTARATDVLTIVRAQEGTSAQIWSTNDHFSNFWTAGQAQTMVQQAQQQAQAGNYAVDTGAVNAMVVTLSPVPASLASLLGSPIRVKVNITNTNTTPTLNVNGLGAQNCVTVGVGGVAGLTIGGCAASKICEFIWDGTNFQYTGRVATASTAMIQAGTDFISPITSLGLTSAFAASTPFATGLNSGNYQKFPNGLIVQWGNFSTTTGTNDVFTLPTAFPNRQFASAATPVPSGSVDVCQIGPNSSPPNITQDRVSSQRYVTLSATFPATAMNVGWILFGN